MFGWKLKTPHYFFYKCGPSSQEVVELVHENVGIINSVKAQYCKSRINT